MYEENRIIKDARVLKEQFIPSRVLHREGQLDAIRACLKPILKGLDPRSVFIFGPPGTGKTCISRYVAEELSAYSTTVSTSYVNCWESSSRFTILYNVLQDMGMSLSVHRKGTPTEELLEHLRKRLEDGYCVIILDEMDKLEDDRVLYDLSALPRACLILISNSETALHSADSRVRSRLASAEQLGFPPYGEGEILDILKDRAHWGLIPGTIRQAQLQRVASASGGDSRIAISTLRIVAEEAEGQDLEGIPDSLIEKALPRAVESSAERDLGMLSPHQRLVMGMLEEGGPVESGALFRGLVKLSSEKGLPEIVDRTFRKSMDRLVQLGMVRAEGEGRWRTYSLAYRNPSGTLPGK